MKAVVNKEYHNPSSNSTGIFMVLFVVVLASIIIVGSTVTGVVASQVNATNSTAANQTEAGQISSSKTKHDTPMNAIRNMK